jgi:hypothetical protein
MRWRLIKLATRNTSYSLCHSSLVDAGAGGETGPEWNSEKNERQDVVNESRIPSSRCFSARERIGADVLCGGMH